LIANHLGLDREQARLVRPEFGFVHLRGGDWLFEQGADGDSLFFLIRGRLQVWLSEAGVRRQLGEVVPGEVIGEIGLLTGEPRTAGIRAARDSALLQLERPAFERLVDSHPRLGIQLAGQLATRLHQRTSMSPGNARQLVNVCLIPIEGSARAEAFCRDLAAELGTFGPVLSIDPVQLDAAGAPITRLAPGDDVPMELVAWLDEREDDHRFVIYRSDASTTPWSRYAVRQADVVVLVAEAGGNPDVGALEAELPTQRGFGAARRALVLLQPGRDTAIRGTAQWLDGRDPDFHLHVRANERGDVQRVARVIAGRAVGLVLGAGAARGIAHIGVFKALREAGVPVDWVGGTSIGAIFGAAIAHDWDPDMLIENVRTPMVRRKPFSDYTLPLFSLLRGRRVVRAVAPFAGSRIEDLPIPFFCVSSNLEDGTLNLHRAGPVASAILASAALPGVFPPRVVIRRLVVDGAVLNPLPVDIMRQQPIGLVIAVDLSSRKTFQLDYDELPSPWAVLRGRLLPFARKYSVPGLVALILKSAEIGTMEKVQQMGADADLLLHPPVRRFGMTEVKAFDAMIELAYQDARVRIAQWLAAEPRSGQPPHQPM
jgi:predicted acylesterase/phospholipase RssA